MITTAITAETAAIPALAPVLKAVFCIPSVAVAAVELEVVAIALDAIVLVDSVLTEDEGTVSRLELDTLLEADVDAIVWLEVVEVTVAVAESVMGDGKSEVDEKILDVGAGTGKSVVDDDISVVVKVNRISDVLEFTAAVDVEGVESSEVDNKVVISLIVAVIVPAIFGCAPATPSQIV